MRYLPTSRLRRVATLVIVAILAMNNVLPFGATFAPVATAQTASLPPIDLTVSHGLTNQSQVHPKWGDIGIGGRRQGRHHGKVRLLSFSFIHGYHPSSRCIATRQLSPLVSGRSALTGHQS